MRFRIIGMGIAILLALAISARDRLTRGAPPHDLRGWVVLDIDYAPDEQTMIREAEWIVRARPLGSPELIAYSSDGRLVSLVQTVQVLEVLKGPTPIPHLRILRLSVTPEARAQGFRIAEEEGGFSGPLPPGEYLLFLTASAKPGIWAVVGHSQGILALNDRGQVIATGAYGFSTWVGMDITDIRERIKAASR
jgi:hypothetical protein